MRGLSRTTIVSDLNASFVCRSCRVQRRRISSSLPPKPPQSGFAPLRSRRLISVSGPDAAKYLQGVITGSIASTDAKPRTSGFYSAFLNSTGRILYDVFIYPDTLTSTANGESSDSGTSFFIEVDSNEVESLAKHIKRYKLRAKFNTRVLSDAEVTVWHAWDDTGNPISHDLKTLGALTQDIRAPGLGYRFLHSKDAPPPFDLEQSSEDAYKIRRYLRGVPEGQDEIIREHGLPQETNMDFMNGLDYHKGCYVGQELTIRTKHRGVVRKRILPCMIYDLERAVPDTLQYRPDEVPGQGPETHTADMIPRETSIGRIGKKGRSAGKWLAGVGNIGLGLCRLEIMTDIVLPGEAASAAFNSTDEFQLQWGGEDGERSNAVKIKAFVPDWIRAGLDKTSAQ